LGFNPLPSVPIAAAAGSILRDQLLRASSSVVLNVAEGFASTSRGVKRRHYEIARGSAVECIAIIDLASTLGGDGGGEARMLFTRAAMMLARLVTRFR
jgi:four helix bundle protein